MPLVGSWMNQQQQLIQLNEDYYYTLFRQELKDKTAILVTHHFGK